MDDELFDYLQDLYDEMCSGDKIQFHTKKSYKHYGICVAQGQDKNIIHLSTEEDISKLQYVLGVLYSNKYLVQESSLFTVAETIKTQVYNDLDYRYRPLPSVVIERVSRQMLGSRGYNLFLYNCEHFANLRRYNKWISEQVSRSALFILALIFSVVLYMNWSTHVGSIILPILGIIFSGVLFFKPSYILTLYDFFSSFNYLSKSTVVIIATIVLFTFGLYLFV